MSVRAEEVADRLALRALVESYAAAVDRLDADLFTSLFTPDARGAVFYRAAVNAPANAAVNAAGDKAAGNEAGRESSAVFTGHGELPKIIAAAGRSYRRTMHLVCNHLCAVDGDTAAGETYCVAHHLLVDEQGTPTDLEMLVHYTDSYARGEDGWRFRERRIAVLWTSRHPGDDSGL